MGEHEGQMLAISEFSVGQSPRSYESTDSGMLDFRVPSLQLLSGSQHEKRVPNICSLKAGFKGAVQPEHERNHDFRVVDSGFPEQNESY